LHKRAYKNLPTLQLMKNTLLYCVVLAVGLHAQAQTTGLTVTPGNNVGIGTTSPGATLDVNGSGQLLSVEGNKYSDGLVSVNDTYGTVQLGDFNNDNESTSMCIMDGGTNSDGSIGSITYRASWQQFQSSNSDNTCIMMGNVAAPVGNATLTVAGPVRVRAGGSIYAPVGGTVFDHYADAGNAGTTETTLYSDIAGLPNSNGAKLTATYGVTLAPSTTATREIKVYYSGNVIFDTGALIFSSAGKMNINVTIVVDSTTSVRYSVTASATGAPLGTYVSVGKVTGLAIYHSTVLNLTGQSAGTGAANNDIVAILGYGEFKPAF
jgi:hypothetical protein